MCEGRRNQNKKRDHHHHKRPFIPTHSPVDDLQVFHRVHPVLHVGDVHVLKGAAHVENAVNSGNVGQEAVASPSPSAAPLTRPAMSTISRKAGTLDLGAYRSQSQRKRSSGTLTRAELGSIVQKGKFSAGMPILVSTLKRVDFPTLGRPTMPTWGVGEGRRVG